MIDIVNTFKENKIFFIIVFLNVAAVIFYRISDNYSLKVFILLLTFLVFIIYSFFKFLSSKS